VAVVLGLLAARRAAPDGDATAADGALAKVLRVLPVALRSRVEALDGTLGFTATGDAPAPVAGATALLLAEAIRRRRRVRAAYRSHGGEVSARELSPHGLVVHSGRWYLAAHDHGRDDLRTFRVDRLSGAALAEEAALSQPDGFDAVAHVSRSLARVPWRWEVEVLLALPLDEAVRRLPPALAELADADGATLLRMRVSSLDWTARLLAGLGCDFELRRPDELRASVGALAARLAASA
jgi:predicted DNA-binding transcriptional regulator YafY